MEYVTPQYEQLLTDLSENLRAERRERFLALLQQTDTQPFIPAPASELSLPQQTAELV